MDNVTSLVDFLNNNSPIITPIINALATLVQAVATIGLFAVTYYLWKAASESGNYVKNQTKIMADQLTVIETQNKNYTKQTEVMNQQASSAEKQTGIMDKQVSFLEKQSEIMQEEAKAIEEDRYYHTLIEKYRRLRDEMDKLVAPLYFAAHTSFAENENLGFFVKLDPRWRNYAPTKQNRQYLISFWDEIRKNMHLSQSDKLIKLLQKHFEYNDDYYSSIFSGNKNEGAVEKFDLNRIELIKEIQENCYPTLKIELNEIELKLGIR